MSELEQLRTLLAAATPGPWTAARGRIWAGKADARSGRSGHLLGLQGTTDAALIAAAVNALPALLDRLDLAEKLADAALDWDDNGQDARHLAALSDAIRDWRTRDNVPAPDRRRGIDTP